jgi:hypothetical protein
METEPVRREQDHAAPCHSVKVGNDVIGRVGLSARPASTIWLAIWCLALWSSPLITSFLAHRQNPGL